MFDALNKMLDSGDYTVVENFVVSPREARYSKIPRFLYDSKVGQHLQDSVQGTGGLWNHQSIALERIGLGENVVISTGTASGKSLIFRSAAFHRVLTNQLERPLVFYPLKALAADQLVGWRDMASQLQLPDAWVGRIDGTVKIEKREEIVRSSRILVMTPDVCHAWMMSNLANHTIREFLRNLGLVILDEAHTLEGVFGSNFAFLFRRILAARNNLLSAEERAVSPNVIAATATISNPAEHLRRLTGLQFTGVSAGDDGSPHYERRCVHMASLPGEEMKMAKAIQVQLLSESKRGGFITFIDSRKGVELLAVGSNKELREMLQHDEVLPYRAGLDSEDRKKIETQLKKGNLRGVISTSALELGIDLPHLQVGIHIGVPATRKAYRQRLGRVGRSSPGAFVILAEANAFTRYGTTFREYHDMSVEPCYLYLDNRFMQYAHARCLVDELEGVGSKEKSTLPTRVQWPNGFANVFQAARPGGDRPKEFDAIAQLGGDLPQRGYPLRNIGEVSFKIGLGEQADQIGEVTLAQALRECYPGGIYYHLAKPYKVLLWRTSAIQPLIQVKRVKESKVTKPRIRTWINAGLSGSDLVEGHLRRGEEGFIAECQMLITERVEGFTESDGGSYRSYQELREKNPNLRPRMRQFRTTGVIVCIREQWFKEPITKGFLADQLRDIFCREYSVLPQDIGTASTNISIKTIEGHAAHSDCIAIFDQTYGSLRLTERAYVDFAHLLHRLEVAAESESGTGGTYYKRIVERLMTFERSLKDEEFFEPPPMRGIEEGGLIQVFAPGSRVGVREKGVLFSDAVIIAPTIFPDGKLWYQVKCPPKHAASPPVKKWVNPEYIEPTAAEGDWEYALWDPKTQEYVQEEEADEPT